jgi:hypothetical protein
MNPFFVISRKLNDCSSVVHKEDGYEIYFNEFIVIFSISCYFAFDEVIYMVLRLETAV